MSFATVKNRAPAPIQITAEQILREARDRQLETKLPEPKRTITDAEELKEVRIQKRKEFEDAIRRQRHVMGMWLKYAKWEAENQEFERARSVYERAVDVDYKNVGLWLRYATMEMENGFVNFARNVWDRAVSLLPRVDQLWYKYAYMEEMLGNAAGARQIFQRWMEWEPEDNAWLSFIKFEERQGDIARAREVFERYVDISSSLRAFLKFAKWEEMQGQLVYARQLYERGMEELAEEEKGERFYIAFADFEERCREHERARAIYKLALDKRDRTDVPELYDAFVAFEKKYGSRKAMEDAVFERRQVHYQEKVKENAHDFDAWLDLIRLKEQRGAPAEVRAAYEEAVQNVPPVREKRFWRRYIYLWINYALYEELQVGDIDRAREVYAASLRLVPHGDFTFAKLWLLAAKFEIRQRDVSRARKILGQALGLCPMKEKLYKGYVELELLLGEVDRCRTVYTKYLEALPHVCNAWIRFAEFERSLEELERTRAIYELAVKQPLLDMPEVLWKAYIDFEIEELEKDSADAAKTAAADETGEPSSMPGHRVRRLFERLLERATHVKIWIAYANFEASKGAGIEMARGIWDRGYRVIKELNEDGEGAKLPRYLLLQAWRECERSFGDAEGVQRVQKRLPERKKRQRMAYDADGNEAGMEEYMDYSFPEDVTVKPNLKLLQRARNWAAKKRKVETEEQNLE
uniref:Suppressor of forked domain-containing protein n=1 Tax=Pinguiococcus pyrenoidosus TaxID=172671 RepID=A0A7R9UG91_9STRA|mmetsp:Transcript_9719/g.36470  ORF Transcript_9719/g.36470 Transcript_9719/m.36470 type:complete len:694 (+) Transcript_9719:120-2201(+)